MDQLERRFRVLKTTASLSVHGDLTDNTNFQVFQGLLTPGVIIDCSGLMSASWIGLTSFYRYLEDYGKGSHLNKVPYEVYRHLRLIPGFGETVFCDSFEARLMSSGPDRKMSYVVVKAPEVAKLAQSMGDFLTVNQGRFMDPASEILPRNLAANVTFVRNYKSEWSLSHIEETDFWTKYAGFCSSTIGLSSLLLDSVSLGLQDMMRQIQTRVTCAELGLSALLPKYVPEQGEYLNSLCKEIQSSCTDIVQKIIDTQLGCDRLSQNMFAVALGEEATDTGSVYASVARLTKTLVGLKMVVPEIESTGSTMGSRILSLKLAGSFKQFIMRVDSHSITPEILHQVREHFLIMDPMSDTSWPDTRAQILSELSEIDVCIGKCVVLLQGFDLVRQVLEHRVSEGSILAPSIPLLTRGTKNWMELAEDLGAAICSTMVTDQEKQACRFFFPELFRNFSPSETHRAGEVLMF